MKGYARDRATDRIVDLSGRGLDVVSFWREATEIIQPVVPVMETGMCWFTIDPTSLLITSHFNEGMPVLPAEFFTREYCEDDVLNITDVVRSRSGIGTLHEAAGGNPSSSPRWQRNMQLGGDQELIASLRTTSGDVWGVITLHRAPGSAIFDLEEIGFVCTIAPALAEGARRGLLLGEASDPEGPQSPGLLVLSADCEVESATPGLEQWISDLPGGDWDAGRLPTAVLTVAGQAQRSAERRDRPGEVALARVLTGSGTWVVLHGVTLVSNERQRTAVIVEPAHPARLTPMLMSAFGLTEREQQVTSLVLQGESTTTIAERLVVSPHTVQQHLKRIFEKTGVHSRRDLVSKVFFSFFEPRVRDNEHRVPQAKPVRGGPIARE